MCCVHMHLLYQVYLFRLSIRKIRSGRGRTPGAIGHRSYHPREDHHISAVVQSGHQVQPTINLRFSPGRAALPLVPSPSCEVCRPHASTLRRPRSPRGTCRAERRPRLLARRQQPRPIASASRPNRPCCHWYRSRWRRTCFRNQTAANNVGVRRRETEIGEAVVLCLLGG